MALYFVAEEIMSGSPCVVYYERSADNGVRKLFSLSLSTNGAQRNSPIFEIIPEKCKILTGLIQQTCKYIPQYLATNTVHL